MTAVMRSKFLLFLVSDATNTLFSEFDEVLVRFIKFRAQDERDPKASEQLVVTYSYSTTCVTYKLDGLQFCDGLFCRTSRCRCCEPANVEPSEVSRYPSLRVMSSVPEAAWNDTKNVQEIYEIKSLMVSSPEQSYSELPAFVLQCSNGVLYEDKIYTDLTLILWLHLIVFQCNRRLADYVARDLDGSGVIQFGGQVQGGSFVPSLNGFELN